MINTKTIVGAAGVLTFAASSALAQPLTGSGPNLPIPSPNLGDPPRQGATNTLGGGGFTGEWFAPADPDWVGTFSAIGPIPSGNTNPTGLTRYDFSTLPLGVAPTGTILLLGDLDGGSMTGEQIILQAFDATGGLLTTPWLDQPYGAVGAGTGPGGAVAPGNMPGWAWNAGTGTYTFSGSTFGPNPSISVFLFTNIDISELSLNRTSGFANFGLSAPLIPAPGAAGLLALAGVVSARRRR